MVSLSTIQLHPGRLTWNIIIEVWKIIFLFKWLISRFHVNLPGCIQLKMSRWITTSPSPRIFRVAWELGYLAFNLLSEELGPKKWACGCFPEIYTFLFGVSVEYLMFRTCTKKKIMQPKKMHHSETTVTFIWRFFKTNGPGLDHWVQPQVETWLYPPVNKHSNIAGWKIPHFSIGNTSTRMVDFPASYVRLPEGSLNHAILGAHPVDVVILGWCHFGTPNPKDHQLGILK